MTLPARSARTPQAAALLALSQLPAARAPQLVLLAAVAPPSAKLARTAEVAALLASSSEDDVSAATTQVAILVAYATGVPDPSRTRAWTYTLDGHTFYVLDLGAEGTFINDTVTQQWAKFNTAGFGQWNMANGVQWGDRIVAGDLVSSYVWELNPDALMDEGWRQIEHVVTGGLQTRSREYFSVDSVRVNASFGQIDDTTGATFRLRFSDDQGKTWSDYFDVTLTEGNYSAEIAWRSLGSFAAPGRVFELSDTGGLIRIDGCDAFIDGFDKDGNQQQQQPQQGG